MVRRWKIESSKGLDVEIPKMPDWTDDDQRQQEKSFAQIEVDGLDPILSGSPFGQSLYGRDVRELLILGLIAGNSMPVQTEAEGSPRISKEMLKKLSNVMKEIFSNNLLKDDDKEIIYEIVREIHRRELIAVIDPNTPDRGIGSSSLHMVTKEILERRFPELHDDQEKLETRAETIRKKVAKHYDDYVQQIFSFDKHNEQKIYLALKEIEQRLGALGIKMDLDSLYKTDVV